MTQKRPGFFEQLFGPRKPKTGAPPPFAEARVAADPLRCVQCGVCGYNCPVGIPVRDYARQGLIVSDPNCVQCGQCIEACPRGTLRWQSAPLRKASPEPGLTYADVMSQFLASSPNREAQS